MNIYTYSEARQNLASLLEKAKIEGEILIKRKDGSFFSVKPLTMKKSPLDVKVVNVSLSSKEIVEIIREGREK